MVVSGVLVPAGTTVWPIMAEVLKGDHWGDGEVFRPERFLDTEGRVVKDEHWVPFSLGRRQCLGETLARAELFLFFTALVQHYTVLYCTVLYCTVQVQHYTLLPEASGRVPEEAWQLGVTSLPAPFKLRLVQRGG